MVDRPEPDTQSSPETAALLEGKRAVPGAEFRGALGRHLAARDPGFGPRPAHLHARVVSWIALGAAVAGVGTLQALGVL